MTHPGRTSEQRLEDLLEFETLISDTSASLFAAPPENLDSTLERSLERVRNFFKADRCALLSVSPDHQVVNVRLGSYAEGIQAVSPDLNLNDFFPWSGHRLIVERAPIRISCLADLPPEAEVEIEAWKQMPIRSALSLPIERAGVISHLIVLNTVHREVSWPDVFVTRLRVLGEMLAGALDRQEMFISYMESEKRLSLAADFAGVGLWSVDTRTSEVWGTERVRRLFGYPPETDLTVEHMEAVIHPEDWDLVMGAMQALKGEGDALDVEYRIVLPDEGTQRWIKSRGQPFFGPAGELETIMGVSLDITDSKTIEEAHRISENRLSRGAKLAGLAFYEVDLDEGIMFVDSALRELCGVPSSLGQGLEVLEFWLESLHPGDQSHVMDQRQMLHTGIVDQITIEYRFLNPVAGQKWIRHLAGVSRRNEAGQAVATFGVLRDISQRKKTEFELQKLSQMLINAHEDERALLARELHDDLTQRLAVLAIDVGRAEVVAENPESARSFKAVGEKLVSLSEDIHSLAYHLHPSVLTELGLIEALQAETDRRNRMGQIKVSLGLEPLPRNLGKAEALCLFRVAQEALNNVVRHADTPSAHLTLKQAEGGVLLTVKDQGAGFDPELSGEGVHLGLVSMRERMRLVNGTFKIDSAPGRGTTVSAWLRCAGGAP